MCTHCRFWPVVNYYCIQNGTVISDEEQLATDHLNDRNQSNPSNDNTALKCKK